MPTYDTKVFLNKFSTGFLKPVNQRLEIMVLKHYKSNKKLGSLLNRLHCILVASRDFHLRRFPLFTTR